MKKVGRGAWGVLVVIVIWYGVALLVSKPFLPTPAESFSSLWRLLWKGLLIHMGVSLWRVGVGLLSAAVLAVPLGLAMGRVEKLDRLVAPILYFLYPIPKITFLPLVMLSFGLGQGTTIFMIALVLFFQILMSARDGIKTLPREYFHVMTSMKSTRPQIYFHVILPGALPKIFTTLRVSMGTALAVLFFSETQAVDGYGLGYFIFDAMLRVQYKEMFAGIIALGFLGWILFKVLDELETHLCPWYEK